MARRTNRANKGSNKLNTVAIVAIIFGVIGIFAIEDLVGKLFFLLIAAAGAFPYIRPFLQKARKEQAVDQPLQQFRQGAPAPEPKWNLSNPMHMPVQPISSPSSVDLSLPGQVNRIPMAYQYLHNEIAMVSEFVRDFDIFRPGDHITLAPEPTNPYDPGAIQLWANNQMLGYVYRGKQQDMINDFVRNQEPIVAKIDRVDAKSGSITYSIAFYRVPSRKYRGEPIATGKLTSCAGSEAQENISLCEEDEELTVDYDYDKERYEVSCSVGFIGCLPKKLHEYADTGTFVIDGLGESDAGKLYVVVGVYK